MARIAEAKIYRCFPLHALKSCLDYVKAIDNTGFTLVELIAVTAIIGVLAAIALPAFNDYKTNARNAACATEIRNIDSAIQAYTIEKNTLPDSLADIGMGGKLDPWKHPYIYTNLTVAGSTPLEDKAGNILNLALDYDLYSSGSDGISFTDFGHAENDNDIVRSNNGALAGLRP